ncbi:hypothetical protein TNCV_4957421 [Trichonephila clavipes]|nr:hypothetical protein TNCV_4957421 [Trichonephila clavipes]
MNIVFFKILGENLNRTMDLQNEVTENEAMENEALANEATPAISWNRVRKKKFESKEKWWRIDKEMVRFKLHFSY